MWNNKQYLNLWKDIHKTSNYISKSEPKNKAHIIKLVAEGSCSLALRKLNSSSSIQPTTDTFNILCQKHPKFNEEPLRFNKINSAILNEKTVLQQLFNFDKNTAPGPCAYRINYITQGLSVVMQTSLLSRITNLCNLILNGEIPSEIRPYILGANLIA